MLALVAWALVMALDVAASADWAMDVTSETMGMALVMEASNTSAMATHPSTEDTDFLASTEILPQEPNS